MPSVNTSEARRPGDADVSARTALTAALVDQLHSIVTKLERMNPGRRFPLDARLVGSIGEAAAEAMFALTLRPASTAGHDAVTDNGRAVEIKATYGTGGVGAPVAHVAGPVQSNGQARLGLGRLRQLDTAVPDNERLRRR